MRTPEPRAPKPGDLDERLQTSLGAEDVPLRPRDERAEQTPAAPGPAQPGPDVPREAPPLPARLPALGPDEVPVFRDGQFVAVIARSRAEAAGMFMLDVGSAWVPSLFRSSAERPHDYEPVFVELANGHFDQGAEGRRAAQERYLEPHGIPPSPALLERRMRALAEKPCVSQIDLRPLREFEGATWDEDAEAPSVPQPVIAALQRRLVCEEHLRVWPSGVLDEDTRNALAEFERRNRIYARGSLKGETLEALRAEPLELERRALLRVLSERMLLDLGVIEDGSAFGSLPARDRGEVEEAPDIVRRVQQRVLEAFGLQSVAGAERFYARLEDALANPHYEIAIDSVELPEYYADDMELWVEIDRGDLYYEFPFDEAGKQLAFRIERGPTMTLFARDGRRVRPLARYPTTIGGWRLRRSAGNTYWEYKESPVGTRAWGRIVTAPVWFPPSSTPAETLMVTFRRTSDGSEFRDINQNLIGPSFASAYGLVAAYHQRVGRDRDGELELGGDDGIRTHGSSDYTSIWRTVSSGCHRLHNHLAMRLFNFVLAHRAHRRIGHRPASVWVSVNAAGFQRTIEITRTGYQFELARPLVVSVLPGRIRGKLRHPLKRRFPAMEGESAHRTILLTPTGPGPS